MASSAKKFSYQRLKQEVYIDDVDRIWEEVIGKSLGRTRFRKLHKIRRRLRVRIPRIKKTLRMKASFVKIAWSKVCQRLKASQAHFGDIFAGNYMFMQVTPNLIEVG